MRRFLKLIGGPIIIITEVAILADVLTDLYQKYKAHKEATTIQSEAALAVETDD